MHKFQHRVHGSYFTDFVKYRFAKSNLLRRWRNDTQISTPCAWIILYCFCKVYHEIYIIEYTNLVYHVEEFVYNKKGYVSTT